MIDMEIEQECTIQIIKTNIRQKGIVVDVKCSATNTSDQYKE